MAPTWDGYGYAGVELVFIGCELRTNYCACANRVFICLHFLLSPYNCPCVYIFICPPHPSSFLLYICSYELMVVLIYVYVEDACAQRLIIINCLNILRGFTHLVPPTPRQLPPALLRLIPQRSQITQAAKGPEWHQPRCQRHAYQCMHAFT